MGNGLNHQIKVHAFLHNNANETEETNEYFEREKRYNPKLQWVDFQAKYCFPDGSLRKDSIHTRKMIAKHNQKAMPTSLQIRNQKPKFESSMIKVIDRLQSQKTKKKIRRKEQKQKKRKKEKPETKGKPEKMEVDDDDDDDDDHEDVHFLSQISDMDFSSQKEPDNNIKRISLQEIPELKDFNDILFSDSHDFKYILENESDGDGLIDRNESSYPAIWAVMHFKGLQSYNPHDLENSADGVKHIREEILKFLRIRSVFDGQSADKDRLVVENRYGIKVRFFVLFCFFVFFFLKKKVYIYVYIDSRWCEYKQKCVFPWNETVFFEGK
ncbi:MAG: hypothetical protein GY714_24740 [Desulfobacterales bacterium]|nr:hypothetical protein [Desulfobacterales bacterium]